MEKLFIEMIVIFIIGFRIYILQKLNIKSAADKIFALYYIKNHNFLLGCFIICYILEIILLELSVGVLNIALLIIFMMELFLVYRHIFIALKTDNKEDYIDLVIKRIFTTLTYSEYQEIKNELTKPQPPWKLYLTEFIVLFFAIYYLEFA